MSQLVRACTAGERTKITGHSWLTLQNIKENTHTLRGTGRCSAVPRLASILQRALVYNLLAGVRLERGVRLPSQARTLRSISVAYHAPQ
jgi:hypothetical protein